MGDSCSSLRRPCSLALGASVSAIAVETPAQDEYQQRPEGDAGRHAHCSFDQRASSPAVSSRLLGTNSRSATRRHGLMRCIGTAWPNVMLATGRTPTPSLAQCARSSGAYPVGDVPNFDETASPLSP